MERYWRPARTDVWKVLLDLHPRQALLYQYIVSGRHTGQTRICNARLGEVAGLFKSKGATIAKDLLLLESEGLIAATIDGSTFEAYPVGSFLECKALSKARLAIVRALSTNREGSARERCWIELASTGDVGLEALEKKHSKPSTLAQRSVNVAPKGEGEGEGEGEGTPTVLAPQASPDQAVKKARTKPKPKAAPVADNPPTLEEIQRYACDAGNKNRIGVTRTFAAKFALYYGDDWTLKNGEPLRDWRRAVSGWVLRDADKNPMRHGETNTFIPESARRRRGDFGGLDD